MAELKGVASTISNENILINTLLQEAKESSAIENIITTHDDIYKADLNLEGFGKNQPQQHFTDFNLLNTKEKETSLSEIIKNNNLTLLLFWSSICHASDGKLQSYSNLYNDFKSFGFEIIGVSDDYNFSRWRNAIKRNKVNWINLLYFDGKNAIEEYFHYNTNGDVLIDKNGIIVARINQISQLKEILRR